METLNLTKLDTGYTDVQCHYSFYFFVCLRYLIVFLNRKRYFANGPKNHIQLTLGIEILKRGSRKLSETTVKERDSQCM